MCLKNCTIIPIMFDFPIKEDTRILLHKLPIYFTKPEYIPIQNLHSQYYSQYDYYGLRNMHLMVKDFHHIKKYTIMKFRPLLCLIYLAYEQGNYIKMHTYYQLLLEPELNVNLRTYSAHILVTKSDFKHNTSSSHFYL